MTNTSDDLQRFCGWDDLRCFLKSFSLDGIELQPVSNYDRSYINYDLVTGVHLNCPPDWMNSDRDQLLEHFRRDLMFARDCHARYVVFHVNQMTLLESTLSVYAHSDQEVIDASSILINELLDGEDYPFWFLMENLWGPGFNLLDPHLTERLLSQVHFKKKGIMLDTGHLMNCNPDLENADEAVCYINKILDLNEPWLPYVRGVHLNQSLSGSYVKAYNEHPVFPKSDANAWMCHVYEHIFNIDQHRPFNADGVRELICRIAPDYVTYEYITRNREELTSYLKQSLIPV